MAESVEPVLRTLFDRRIIFVGGKGGVGKTTVAAALATAFAGRGRRCLLVSTDPAHSLGDIFGRTIGGVETPLAEKLHALEIDPDAETERHIASVKTQMKSLVHPKMYAEVERQMDLARSAPGAMEAALLERIADVMIDEHRRFDEVIFDTAPTGHTLRLLALPQIMAAWTDGLLRHREHSSRLSSVLRRLGGGSEKGDELSLIDTPGDRTEDSSAARLTALLRNRQRKFGEARRLLLDRETTAYLLVLNPDRLSILESRKARDSLDHVHVPITALVVNRVLTGEADSPFFEARRRQEAPYLLEIDREFARIPRLVLPLLPEDVHGLEVLRRVGRRLVGSAED